MLNCGCAVLRCSIPSQILLPWTSLLQQQPRLTASFGNWGCVPVPVPTPFAAVHFFLDCSQTCCKADDLELLNPRLF